VITTLPFGLVGEAALLDEPRNATVTAKVDSYVLKFPAAAMKSVVERVQPVSPAPRTGMPLLASMRRQRANRSVAYHALRASPFGDLPDSVIDPLFLYGEIEAYDTGAVIMQEGKAVGGSGKDLYIIIDGWLSVTKEDDSLVDVTVGNGDIIGERALLTHEPRSATVTALGPVRVLRLPQSVMRYLLEKYPGIAIALNRLNDERQGVAP
jgi:CRP-like cAMP-binding protein